MKGRNGRVTPRGRIRQFGARIFRIENIVLDEFKAPAVIFISPAFGDHVDRRRSRAPKLGVVVRSLHDHFLNEIDPHLIEHAVVRAGVQIKPPVHAPVLPVQPLPVGNRDAVIVVRGQGRWVSARALKRRAGNQTDERLIVALV